MNITKKQLKQIIQEEYSKILDEQDYYEVDAKDINEEYCPVCTESQKLEEMKEL